MSTGVMSYSQTLNLMRQFAQDLNIEIDLSGYIDKNTFLILYQEFENALAKKVDTEIYTEKMKKIEESIKGIKSDIFPIDLSSSEQIVNTLDISHGGTNGTTVNEAQYNLLNDLTLKSTGFGNDDYLVYSKPDQSKENGSIGKIRTSAVWDWMKHMIEEEGITPDASSISNDEIDFLFF